MLQSPFIGFFTRPVLSMAFLGGSQYALSAVLVKARTSTAACIGRHNWRAYRREAQFGCGIVGHTARPHKPFVSKFVWPRLPESCAPPIFSIILLPPRRRQFSV